MSLQTAYTTQFRSLDDTLWEIVIAIEDYAARPMEIKLEGDEPCVIEWQETGKMDVVQSSTCTLRVSNESDRQMVQLMSNRNAACQVNRNGKIYWFGYLDDAIYEEPYSFTQGYVTELTFSDFGLLNRLPFTLTGRQSVAAIVFDCLQSIGYGIVPDLYTSLLEPKTQQPITLDMLYINADRFASDGDSWDEMTTKREVLEEVLRPLGLRIMQKNAQIHIYDIEYLRDHDNFQTYPVWKGTDAHLRGSETYGWFEVDFETDARETLADGKIDEEKWIGIDTDRNFATSYNTMFETDGDTGFYIDTGAVTNPPVTLAPSARFFHTRAVFSDSSELGIAWRVRCETITGWYWNPLFHDYTAQTADTVLVDNHPAKSMAETEDVFSIETGYLPVVPDSKDYQLRVNLDVLVSFRPDPIDNPPDEWVRQQSFYLGKESVWRYGNYMMSPMPKSVWKVLTMMRVNNC